MCNGSYMCICWQNKMTNLLIEGGISSSNSKHKEVYKYEAPHTLYSTGWSQHPDPSKKFRLALASFIEEYNNKVLWLSLYFLLL